MLTSLANEGPDKNTAGCLRPSADGMTSDMSCPVLASTPLLTLMMGTSGGRMSLIPCKIKVEEHQVPVHG